MKLRKIFRQAYTAAAFFRSGTFMRQNGSSKKYPKVIQLPITYKCNSRCVMCNIWKMDHSGEADGAEFSKFMTDPLFQKVTAVGINGGEPSLVRSLPEYAKEILKLPSLRSLNIISHGFNKKLLLSCVSKIYSLCKEAGVRFHVSISLDGYDEVHDRVRGIDGVFSKTTSTIMEIKSNQDKYCDSLDLGCTVVKQNVDELVLLDNYVNKIDAKIKYRLGIENKRIESDKIKGQYSVIYAHEKQSAAEFFHWQLSRSGSVSEKFKYFSIFYFLTSEKPKRLLGCAWREEGVTLDSRGELYYCAVASRGLGSLRENSGENIFFEPNNIQYRKKLIKESCDSCIHDYSGKTTFKDMLNFFYSTIRRRYAMKYYKALNLVKVA